MRADLLTDGRLTALSLTALPGLPLVEPGADLAALLLEGLARAGLRLEAGDVLVLAQKIVSKAEGRLVELSSVTPSPPAIDLARRCLKDPRLVELILRESREVVRATPGVIIVEHKRGWVLANAGIDRSNAAPGSEGRVLLLPEDPDGTAERLRQELRDATGADTAIVIADSVGRAWRLGTVGIALGSAGLRALDDQRGAPDLFGRALESTEVAQADQLAAAATLLMGQAAEGLPAVLIRGLLGGRGEGRAADLLRPRAQDLFR